VAVSSSLLTESVAADVGIPLASLYDVDALDIAVDGADEVDPHLNLIKGGGGNLTREKVLAAIAKRYVAVVGGEKLVARLGANFPVFVEVIEFARPVVTRLIERMGATVTTRANPDGTPFLTDNHNPYLHCRFGPPPYTLSTPGFLEDQLRILPGVVETGLFINLAHEILVANADGTIGTLRK
jgi:ribose 5-phosphate isomerase A